MTIKIAADDLGPRTSRWNGRTMIESLSELARKELTRWERGFLDSIEGQLATRGFLTRGQRERLEELYTEPLG